MLFPYKDDNPRVLFPFITFSIIGINIIIFLLQFLAIGNDHQYATNLIYNYGFIPNTFNPLTIITSMFIHSGFSHIIGNMWFLYIFGDNVESILGHVKFFCFYLACGIGAALAQYIIQPHSIIPMVGASGAIAGVLGAYMIRFPKARVHIFVMIIVFFTTFVVPAQIVLGIWFIMQLSGGLNSLGVDTTGGVAWFAHIGGFIVGISTIQLFQNLRIDKT